MWVERKMFTCCKNTFPNFNITHSHFQAFIHSFLVRWLDVSAKRKQNRRVKGEKKVQTCAQRDWGESGFYEKKEKKMQEAVLHYRGRKPGMRDKRQRATAGGYVCILNPEREKVTNSHHNFLFFFFFFNFPFFFFFVNRPHQCPLCPPPTSHTGALALTLLRAAEWWGWAGQSHTHK